MKKVMNRPEDVVREMLSGIEAAHPERLRRLEGTSVIVRRNLNSGKVALISGGGSGHEPAHAGFVGRGMLDAAVSGEVFTSPTPDQVLAGIRAIQNPQGVLMIVKNYSGDIMNFEMAGEMAEMEGLRVARVVVNDDVAVEDSTYTTGRRGIAGTVLVHKIAGAKAERGGTLEEVHAVAEKAIANVRSKGMALSSCVVPAVGRPTFELGPDEMEIGLGIHGEPGTRRARIMPADDIAEDLVGSILADLSFQSGDEVALLINGLGATPLMELYILNHAVSRICHREGLRVIYTRVGESMTSLEMAGASVSLLRLDGEMKELLFDPADAPAWTEMGGRT